MLNYTPMQFMLKLVFEFPLKGVLVAKPRGFPVVKIIPRSFREFIAFGSVPVSLVCACC